MAVSSVGLLFFPLLMIPIGVGIKMSSKGPVFYRQLRTGRNGRLFTCYKFRTMYNNTGTETVERNDPRVTSFGAFLRRRSLDELPQIVNVFLGQMSLVGPRPHMLSHTLFYGSLIDGYGERLSVKPGITGLAQIEGYRGATDRIWKMQKRIDFDRSYISHWSMWKDLKIIGRTLVKEIRGDENAF